MFNDPLIARVYILNDSCLFGFLRLVSFLAELICHFKASIAIVFFSETVKDDKTR